MYDIKLYHIMDVDVKIGNKQDAYIRYIFKV